MNYNTVPHKLCLDGRYLPMDLEEEKQAKTRLSWNKLKSIEVVRRSILFRAELPFWRILLFWKGTCLKEITLDPFVWAVFAIYASIRVKSRFVDAVPKEVELMDEMNLDILGGFLSFFLVLFVNQTQARFLTMYGFSKDCAGRVQDVAGLARAQLPINVAQKIVRHLNAAHVAGYVGLNGIGMPCPYSKAHFFGHYNKKNELITSEEKELIDPLMMDSGGAVMKELVTWCQEDIANAKKAGHIDSYEANMYHERILKFRAAMDSIYDYTDQPPHFFYIHFLALLSFVYLPLFAINTAYSTGWGDDINLYMDILNGVTVLLQCFFVLGLRSLGTKMIDPYGPDLEDLSVIHYCDSTLETCNQVINSKQVGSTIRHKDIFNRASIHYNKATVMDKRGAPTILEP